MFLTLRVDTETLRDQWIEKIFTVMSCFHYCHPDYFLTNDGDDGSDYEQECRDEAETHLPAISEAAGAFSPNATE